MYGWSDGLEQLNALDKSGLRRALVRGATDSNSARQIDFSSNDYLGLSVHPRVTAAAIQAIEQYGAGSRASRLVTGNLPVHDELEAAIAAFKSSDAALVFSSGYLANLGVIQLLSRRADGSSVPVFFDRLSHASIVDGAVASGRPWRTFAHNDPTSLERQLVRINGTASPRALVLTEGVFSMDGDIAPLSELLGLCEKHDALLVVDDAHGTGTLGELGLGTASYFHILPNPRIVHVGTLSKALGSQGGFVAGGRVLVDLLINRARSFMYDTALAPACAAAALESIRVVVAEPQRVQRLQENSELLRDRLKMKNSPTPILPVIIGEADAAMKAAAQLQHEGYRVLAIRPPTVPRGSSRLRITVSSQHTQDEILSLAQAMDNISSG